MHRLRTFTGSGTVDHMLLAIIIVAQAPAAIAAPPPVDWAAELNAIADQCRVPKNELQWIDGAVRWTPPAGEPYEKAKCVFDALKAREVPTKQGFVNTH